MLLSSKLPIVIVSMFCLSGCATYQSQPLPTNTDLAENISALKVNADSFLLAQLEKHPFNSTDGLDGLEVAMLAVANNPALKASRGQRGEAAAQVYAAGLLPDPQFSVGLEKPSNGGAERVDGFDLGLGIDLQALITRGARSESSKASLLQIDLELLWQEWQVVQQARLLTVNVQSGARKQRLLEAARDRYKDGYKESQRLLEKGDLTLDTAGAVASVWFNAESRLNHTTQVNSRERQGLHALLGLAASVELPLAPLDPPPLAAIADLDEIFSELPQRRPDLLALQAGYQSQEQRVRKAILSQFPALSVGFTRARDTDGLYTTGFGVSLDLPVFSGHRGQIAQERATRQRLHAEYQARLSQAGSDVFRLLERQRLLALQRAQLLQRQPELESLIGLTRHAYQRGDLPGLNLFNLETTQLEQGLEMIELEQTLWQVRIALDTLLALPESEE